MTDRLQDMFSSFINRNASDYGHQDAVAIIEGARALLRQIPTGQKLLAVQMHYNIPVDVIADREITYNVLDDKFIQIFCPNPTPKDLHLVALALALGIRDVEQCILGFRLTTKNIMEINDIEEKGALFSKSLDIILTMCRIGEEFSFETGYTNLIDYIAKIGHADLYKGYKAKKTIKELEEIFKRGLFEGS